MATRPYPIDPSVPAATRSDVDPQSDEGLVREMIGGSEAALGSLYDRHVNVVFAAALRTARDRGIAAEVVQETFLAMWNQAERFDPVRGHAPVVAAHDRAQSSDRSAPRCRTPRPRRGLLVVRAGRPGRPLDRRMAHLGRGADRVGGTRADARGRPDESRGSIGDRSGGRRPGSHGTCRDHARLRLRSVAVRDRGPTGLADRDGQDADATRAAPTPRSARRDALERRGVRRVGNRRCSRRSRVGTRLRRSELRLEPTQAADARPATHRPPTAMSPCQC